MTMLGFKVNQAKSKFLDRKAVIDAVGKAGAASLAKAGGYVRTTARRLIKLGPKKARKSGQRHSLPGHPPWSIIGLLKDFIFFAFDFSTHSEVIGPAKLDKPGTAPATLEYGGDEKIFSGGKPVLGHYQPRPYMKPALELSLPKLPEQFRNSIKG